MPAPAVHRLEVTALCIRVEELRRQVAGWHEARRSREYVSALRAAIESHGSRSGPTESWLNWAEAYIERIDPMTDVSTIAMATEATDAVASDDSRGTRSRISCLRVVLQTVPLLQWAVDHR
jgi:hypothetical protein